MTDTMSSLPYLFTWNGVAGARPGIADHETLISLTRRVVLWEVRP